MQSAGKLLNNRGLTRSADGKIANANHETAQCTFAENSFAIKIKPELHEPVVNERERVKNPAQDRSANAVTSFENDVDPKLFQAFKPAAHLNCRLAKFALRDCLPA